MSDFYEHLEAAWNDLSKEDKERFISGNIRRQQPIPHNPQNHKPMTQEYKAKELRDKICDFIEKASGKMLLPSARTEIFAIIMQQQQPIPQDINKWIEDEADKKYPTMDVLPRETGYHENDVAEKQQSAFIAGAQLLLPELQQQKETIKERDKSILLLMDDVNKFKTAHFKQSVNRVSDSAEYVDEIERIKINAKDLCWQIWNMWNPNGMENFDSWWEGKQSELIPKSKANE